MHQASLNDANKESLRKMAEYLKNNPSWGIEIQGHADVLGKDRNYAIAVGERRATAVKWFLAVNGVNKQNLHIISYGKEKPSCADPGKECR